MNDSTATFAGNHPAAHCELHSRPEEAIQVTLDSSLNVSWASTASGGGTVHAHRAGLRDQLPEQVLATAKHRAICCRHCWPPHPPSRRTCEGSKPHPGTAVPRMR